jgi:hypothetical protein
MGFPTARRNDAGLLVVIGGCQDGADVGGPIDPAVHLRLRDFRRRAIKTIETTMGTDQPSETRMVTVTEFTADEPGGAPRAGRRPATGSYFNPMQLA